MDERRGILELNRKSCDVPQETSKPSLKPLTKNCQDFSAFRKKKKSKLDFLALCAFESSLQ